jgi:hypothetical protein
MTDPKIDIKAFATKEEVVAKAWFGTNWVPFAVGMVSGILVTLLIHHL